MKTIEQNMIHAINTRRNFRKSNTEVRQYTDPDGDRVANVYLHNNLICRINYTRRTKQFFTRGWHTVTTKSRLNALDADICQRNFVWYNRDGSQFKEGQIINY